MKTSKPVKGKFPPEKFESKKKEKREVAEKGEKYKPFKK